MYIFALYVLALEVLL